MSGSFDSGFDSSFDNGAADKSAIKWSTVEDAIWAWIVAGSGLAGDHVTWAQQTAPRPSGEFISMRLTVLSRSGRDWLDRYDNVIALPTLTITAVSTSLSTLTIAGHNLLTGTGPLVFGGVPPAPLALETKYWPIVVDANTIKLASSFQNAMTLVPLALTNTGTSPTLGSTPTTAIAGQEISQRARGPRQGVLTLQCFAGTPTGGAATGFTSPTAILHDAISSYVLESRSFALNAAGIGVGRVDPIQSIDGIVNSVKFEPRAIGTVHLHLASELVETSTYIQVVNATNLIPTPYQVLPPIVIP